MNNIRWIGALLLFVCAFGAFGQEETEAPSDGTRYFGRAFAEAAAVNGALHIFNRFVTRAEYAQVSLDSIRNNVAAAWVWDQDDFLVNQIAHPYHGSYYFISGRANGVPFYRSSLVSLAGSVSWELFCENETPSKNDLIVTTLGGGALGEMFHRLYLSAAAAESPFAFIISPMDALNRSHKRPASEGYSERVRYSLSAGFSALLSVPEGRNPSIPASFNTVLAVDYGYPYGRDSRVPFSSFEQVWMLGGSLDSFQFNFFSDGFLRSWALRDDDKRRTSAGISLHYDFIFDSVFNFSANSLGATIKQERFLRNSSSLQLKTHLNWIALGASDNTPLRDLYNKEPSDVEKRDYDIGTGVGFKLALNLMNPILGILRVSLYRAGVFLFPSSVPEGGSGGSVWIDMLRMVYEHGVSDRVSLGLSLGLYQKITRYDEAPNDSEGEANLGVFIKREFR